MTGPKLDIADLVQEGRIHKRLFRDPAIFELEMERIFEQTWVYVAHESEIAHGGDYKATWIGRQPVIVTRHADDGQVYVLYNSCAHRGATVCQQEAGNANYFRCGYHGWTYNNRGDLVGLPYREGYGTWFEGSEHGLVPVPRVDIYRGFIFASLSAEGPGLEEHLGNARPYIDLFAGQGPDGIEIRADIVHKSTYNGNWKFQLENANDVYHFEATHQSLEAVRRRRGERSHAERMLRGGPENERLLLDLGNGHSAIGTFNGPGMEPGRFPSNLVLFPAAIFPNLVLLDVQVRHVLPKAHDYTELRVYPVRLKGVPDDVNEQRLRKHEEFYGPAGFGAPDDWEQFERVQVGALAMGREWLLYDRCRDSEVVDEATGIRGTPWAARGSEVTLRGFYRQWKRMMTAV